MSPVIRLGRRGLLTAATGLLAAPAIVRAQGQAGVALVIGNSKYQWEAQLPNVQRDAPDIARTFEAMGLKTELVTDAGKGAMQAAIEKFAAAAKGANFAGFYFAGHGTQFKNQTFLVPVDADLSTPKTDGLINTVTANRACNGARANFRIYDNCRNNPADGWQQAEADDRSLVRGSMLASFAQNNPNSLAIFSTAPGRVALDGPAGQNSPFAAAVLRQLDAPSVDLSTLAQRIRRDVAIATRGRQVVVDSSSYQQPFAVKGAGLGRPALAPAAGMIELPGAYAYAATNNMPLPAGLVAFRPAGGAAQQQKVGSFKYTVTWNKTGESNQLLLVLAVDSDGTPEFVIGGTNNGGWWRFVKGQIEGDSLDYTSHSENSSPHFNFRWREARGGSLTISWPKQQKPPKPVTVPFERLDG
jgi:hypothetical protein